MSDFIAGLILGLSTGVLVESWLRMRRANLIADERGRILPPQGGSGVSPAQPANRISGYYRRSDN